MAPAKPVPLKLAIAATTAIAGISSLLLFGLCLWTGAFHLMNLGLQQTATLAWDTAPCALFFPQHSGMVCRNFRTWLSRYLPLTSLGIVYTIASGLALTYTNCTAPPGCCQARCCRSRSSACCGACNH